MKLFITGGFGDIGSGIKKFFQVKGYEVVSPSRNELDLLDSDSISTYFTNRINDFDIFIHCAGINVPCSIDKISFDNIEKTAMVNYLSFINITKYILPYMQEHNYGKVLAISSLYGSVARVGRLAYVSSKHALEGAIKTYACEYGEQNILFNCLAPGFVDTKMTRKNNSPETVKKIVDRIPIGRLATVNDIASVAYYLCSPENSYITGQTIIVDGGFMAEGGQHSL